jgi:hypothetical protein
MIALILNIVAAELTLGAGRTIPTIAAVIGLFGVASGLLSVIRPALFRLSGPSAVLLGFLSAVVGGLHASYAAGGVGTGNGLAGAVVAVALGIIGILLGAVGYSRTRRTT